jgi:hypothetical protein
MESTAGTDVLDLDPVGGRHRHLRIGPKVWDRMMLKTPWGETVGRDMVADCHINGRSALELMDVRVPERGPPTAVVTWMGAADDRALRCYARAVEHAQTHLARQADKALDLEANREPIVREAAEATVYRLIKTSERSGVPHGDMISDVVADVLDRDGTDGGLGSRLDGRNPGQRERNETGPHQSKTSTDGVNIDIDDVDGVSNELFADGGE